jgi:hypothetical protein
MTADALRVILFFSSNHAIWAARVLDRRGIAARLVPTPRHLSSECGHAVELRAADAARAAEALAARGVPFDRVEEAP